MKNKKLWIILSAIALLLIAVIISLIVYFSTGDVTGTKKKKKIIKVYKPSSQTSDDSYSEDFYEENTFYQEETEEDNTSNEVETSEESDNSNVEDTKSPYAVEFDTIKNAEADKQIGYSIYHYFNIGEWQTLTNNKYGDESSFINYYHVGSVEQAKKVKEMGGMGWIHISTPFSDRNTLSFKSSWKNTLEATVEAYKTAGVWDSIAGFHTEELMLTISGEQFRLTTKYLRDNWPEKRIFACVSAYELNGYRPDGVVDPMTYKTYGYITDIGFDTYHTYDYAYLKDMVNRMKQQIGRSDVRIWFFPCTFGTDTSQEFMINHLNVCYKLLLEEENPGGLDLYTWKTWTSSMAGLDRLLDPALEYKYDKLADRIVEIGKEIKNNPYRYEKPLN